MVTPPSRSVLRRCWPIGPTVTRPRAICSCRSSTTNCAASHTTTCAASVEGHTLQTTALVNEVYLRLAGIDALQWRDRAHFFAMAATLMRRVLVDYARQRARDKRGAGVSVTSLDENAIAPQPAVDVVALDEALERLAAVDPQQSRVVELRFFAGLSVKETAEALGVSPATVKRDWATAKLWLYNELMTRMNTLDDWPRVKRVLEGALACEGADRQAYLAEPAEPTRRCGRGSIRCLPQPTVSGRFWRPRPPASRTRGV